MKVISATTKGNASMSFTGTVGPYSGPAMCWIYLQSEDKYGWGLGTGEILWCGHRKTREIILDYAVALIDGN